MIDLALDPKTNDLLIIDFDAQLVSNVDQIAQNLAIRLRFFQGEWYLNIFAGIPYYQYFFIKNPNQIQVETFLTNEIANTRGVTEITEFSSNFDGASRKFNVDFSCIALDENVQMELQIP
ncbi:MAG: hypothetical protein C5B43_01335 [Verrucomicrobia bacterium]|nr:MAG: hypothetical protein C5B43_01335 [Verrucomicrobiota bacterium]